MRKEKEDISVDLNSLPREVTKPLTEYLLKLMKATESKLLTGVIYSGIIIKNVGVVTEFDKYSGEEPVDIADFHQEDATGVPDEPLDFEEEDPLNDDYDPQF